MIIYGLVILGPNTFIRGERISRDGQETCLMRFLHSLTFRKVKTGV